VRIEAEILLPEQLSGEPAPRRGGEVALLWAILTDGVQSYCRLLLTGATNSSEFREAQRWIFTRDAHEVTSFESLCEVFDFDPDYVRSKLRRFREQKAA
jgi:hypothetical protein